MKLVDILARELAEWPKESVKAMQDFDKEIRFFDSIGDQMASFDFYVEELACDACDEKTFAGGGTEVSRAEWQAAVDALNSPKVVEWDGLGRPPEGTVCGLWYKGCDQGECTVLFMGAEVGVFKSHAFDHEQHGDLVHYSFYKVEGSTEEKDAQERKKAIAEMTAIAGVQYSPRDSIVQRLFDAGYRKEPKPCGS